MGDAEKKVQNEIRLALSPDTVLFRANVGQAWTGNDCRPLRDGSVVITDARPFKTGLPAGFSDLFGIQPVMITEDMVGQTVGLFVAIEVKAPRGRDPTDNQSHFLQVVRERGGRAGVARSVSDAENIVKGG
jgi:hypothetical protein